MSVFVRFSSSLTTLFLYVLTSFDSVLCLSLPDLTVPSLPLKSRDMLEMEQAWINDYQLFLPRKFRCQRTLKIWFEIYLIWCHQSRLPGNKWENSRYLTVTTLLMALLTFLYSKADLKFLKLLVVYFWHLSILYSCFDYCTSLLLNRFIQKNISTN